MSQDISKPTLGEQFLAEIYSHSNEKNLNLQDFHAEQIVYYNCAHCNSIANHSCAKKHRHNIEAFTKEEFDVLCEDYMNKKKLSKN